MAKSLVVHDLHLSCIALLLFATICNAGLDAWPDEPHLDVIKQSEYFGPLNANSRFAVGLLHDDSHLARLREIMRQARGA